MVHFFVPGKPTGKGRPRVCRKVTYTPKATQENGLAYADDNQVTDLVVYKQYATTDEGVGVVVNIKEKRLVE